jgi:hypothetical protein
VLPEATLAVWYWRTREGSAGGWQLRRELPQVPFEGFMNP